MSSLTTQIAVQQDQLIAGYKAGQTTCSAAVLASLQNNLWINTAYSRAPDNLVIRQLCLIDLFKSSPGNKAKIQNLLDILTYKTYLPKDSRIFAEGYSYWLYTRDALDLWINRFKTVTDLSYFQALVMEVDASFVSTSYLRGTVWYPAPFGDLRDGPLAAALQMGHTIKNVSCKIVTMSMVSGKQVYSVRARPIGMNTHTSTKSSVVTIVNGIPKPFTFYTGYDQKYTSPGQEMLDILNPKRILSLFR